MEAVPVVVEGSAAVVGTVAEAPPIVAGFLPGPLPLAEEGSITTITSAPGSTAVLRSMWVAGDPWSVLRHLSSLSP